MKNKKIFITGASGGLGSDFVDYFKEKNLIVCSDSTLDITDRKGTFEIIKANEPDIVIHLAAICGTKDCEEVPEQAIKTNVLGTTNVVQAVREIDSKFIYFSTTAIFKPGVEPIREDSPIAPYTIYGKTKYWGEEIARRYIPKNDLLVVRPCFGFGGRTDVSMLGALIRSHFTKKYVNLLLDMNKKKDYMSVRNISHALYLMIDQETFGESFNVSYGESIPYGDIIKKLNQLGIYPYWKNFPELDYMGNHVVSNEKIVKELGYKNLISLDDGIKMVVDTYTK